MSDACPFCDKVLNGAAVATNADAVAFEDAFPVNPGHTLVVPRAHADDLFSLPAHAVEHVWHLVSEIKAALTARHAPDGFTIGVNVAAAGGQTVDHAHVHVIPRYEGDVDDPRGGIRWVVPERARYWT